ncbi:MAG: helix-turn-helix domain-containing protein [Solirubrobacteraceae bacterium]
MTPGEIVRNQRQFAELPIRQVAALARISNAHVSQIEHGLRIPSPPVLDAIAGAPKTSADRLYEQAGITPPGAAAPDGAGMLAAIDVDPLLVERQRGQLRETYEAFVAVSPRAERQGR